MEIWKPVSEYENGYEVSSYGRIRSINKLVNSGLRHNQNVLKRGKVLKANLKRNGYFTIDLCGENTKRTTTVHRIVAKAFVDNPDNKPQVNHKDGNKQNNHYLNLEWVTGAENQKHRFDALGHTGRRKEVICIETGVSHASSYHAAIWLNSTKFSNTKQTGVLARKIRKCCVGEKTSAYDYQWRYSIEGSTTSPNGRTLK